MKTKTKLLLTSMMTIAFASSLVAGSTYALFTDKADVNIAVTSGKIKVSAEVVEEFKLWSLEEGVQKELKEGATSFANGGTVSYKNKTLTLDRMTPGDKVEFKINVKNESNVAVKYRTVLDEVKDEETDEEVSLLSGLVVKIDEQTFTGKKAITSKWKTPETDVESYTVSVELPKEAENEYQDLTSNLVFSVEAVQGNAETFDDVVYPEGFSAESFDDGKVAVTDSGVQIDNTASSIQAAINAGGTLYFKEDATLPLIPAHTKVLNDVTIYANGANFGGRDIDIGAFTAPTKLETTVNVYNAVNLGVWGQPVANRADVWNVNLYNCEVTEGKTFLLMYRAGDGADLTAKINFTMKNCVTDGYTDSIVHTTADGVLNISNCTFNNNPAPVNIAHKQDGKMDVTVENCTFYNCGKVAEKNSSSDYFAPARFVNNNTRDGELNVLLKNNTFTDTVWENGDILLCDFRADKVNSPLTCEIVTATPVMVKTSAEPAFEYNGGTLVVNAKN